MRRQTILAGVSIIALALAAGAAAADDNGAFAEINADTVSGNTASDPGQIRPNDVTNSFNNAAGIAQVQQNEGSANSMNIATAVQTGINNAGAVTASALANSSVYDNDTSQDGGTRSNDVDPSFTNFSGVASVQQNNGDHNEMGIANAVQAQVGGATASSASATSNSEVEDNDSWQDGGSRDNAVTSSFNGASGVATVQQNNGDQNALGVTNAVQASISGTGPASASADVESEVEYNETSQDGGSRDNVIDPSFTGFEGVATVQQNNGNQNAIGAANAVQADIAGTSGTSSSTASVELDVEDGNAAKQDDGTRDNDVTTSFNSAHGVVTVQQNNGDQNAVGAANAVAVGLGNDGTVTANADVDGWNDGNDTSQYGGERTNDITNSFGTNLNNSFSGVATVQQNNGDNNTIGAATALHANLGGRGNINQTAGTEGDIRDQEGYDEDDEVLDDGSTRSNTIDPSFVGAEGIMTVQQNNGNANTVGASTSVVANVGGIHPKDDVSQTVEVEGTIRWGIEVVDIETDRDNTITGSSFNASRGIVTVQQNNGDVNVLGVATAVNANVGIDGSQVQNDVTQDVSVWGHVAGADSFDQDASFASLDPQGLNGITAGQRNNTIGASFNAGAAGIASVQQNNGSQNVMGIGTAVSANVDTTAGGLDGTDNVNQVQARAAGGSAANDAEQDAGPLNPPPSHRENLVSGSFGGYSGMVSVEQNNGDNNVMGIANAVAASVRSNDKFDGVTGSMAETWGYTAGNDATEGFFDGANRDNTINPSFNSFDGIATVQQNNGQNNVINGSNTVVANVGTTTDGAAGSVSNSAVGTANVLWNQADDDILSDRVNTVTSSFSSAAGMMTVQQNNGDNNVMGAANAVAAEINTGQTGFGPAVSLASLNATVSGNSTTASWPLVPPGRANVITASFGGASGVMVVQQNNGSNNAIQSAVSVTATLTGFDGVGFLGNLQ